MSIPVFTKLPLELAWSIRKAVQRPSLRWASRSLSSRSLPAPSASRQQTVPGAKNNEDLKAPGYLPESYVRPTAIWLSPSGHNVNTEQILKQLPVAKEAHLRHAMFLVTPKFAHLFDSGSNFYASAINHIWPPQSYASRTTHHSVVAVVDAIPAISHEFIKGRDEICGYEGVAVCLSHRLECTLSSELRQDIRATISFRSQKLFDHPEPLVNVVYTAPVANTLFLNGRQHTMFKDVWTKRDSTFYDKNMRTNLAQLEIPLYETNWKSAYPAALHGSLQRLTGTYEIVSSMGNIIRQLRKSTGDVVSASHDLEHIIPPLAKKKQEENSDLEMRIFAFVRPAPELLSSESKPNIFRDRWFHQAGGVSFRKWRLGGHNHHHSILQRGRLYRVTSGGAGWGKHAGLLSLEPMTQINEEPSDELSMFPSFDSDEGIAPRSDFFPPGHIIQFMVTWHDTKGIRKDGVKIDSIGRDPIWRLDSYLAPNKIQKFCIGNVVLPEIAASKYETPESASPEKSELVFCPHRFGFLTTSAWSVSMVKSASSAKNDQSAENSDVLAPGTIDKRMVHSTLIEAPNSYALATCSAGTIIEDRESTEGLSPHRRRKHPRQESEALKSDATRDKPAVAQATTFHSTASEPQATVRTNIDWTAHSSPEKPKILHIKVRDKTIHKQLTSKRSPRYMPDDDPRMGGIPDHLKEIDLNRDEQEFRQRLYEQNKRSGRDMSRKEVSGPGGRVFRGAGMKDREELSAVKALTWGLLEDEKLKERVDAATLRVRKLAHANAQTIAKEKEEFEVVDALFDELDEEQEDGTNAANKHDINGEGEQRDSWQPKRQYR